MNILVNANNGMSSLIQERKKEGSKVKNEMQESIQDQLTHKVELQTDLARIENHELVQLRKDRTDVETDRRRLDELNSRYD